MFLPFFFFFFFFNDTPTPEIYTYSHTLSLPDALPIYGRPPIVPLTEYDARELLSKPLVDLGAEHGPTRVAGSVGCDEKTIRNARDEKSTLRLDFASNLLALDGRALDPILNH